MFAHRISKRWNWGHRRLYWRWMQYDSSKNSLFWTVFQLSKPFPHSTTTKPKHTLRVPLTAPSMRHFADTTWHQALTSTMALGAQDETTEDLSDALCGLCLLTCSPWACFPFSTIFPFIFVYRDSMVYALAFHRLKAEQMEHRSQKTLAFKTSYSKNFQYHVRWLPAPWGFRGWQECVRVSWTPSQLAEEVACPVFPENTSMVTALRSQWSVKWHLT